MNGRTTDGLDVSTDSWLPSWQAGPARLPTEQACKEARAVVENAWHDM